MNIVLFNVHDLTLILSIVLSILLGTSFFLANRQKSISALSFLLFCLCCAAIPLDTLISFGAGFRDFAVEHMPNWFYVFEVAYWLQAPFLWLFVRSRTQTRFSLSWLDISLFVPCLLFSLHQIFAYHSLPTATKIEILEGTSHIIESFSIYYVVALRELLRLIVFGMCFHRAFIWNSQSTAANHHGPQWLKVLILGFLFITLMSTVNSFFIVAAIDGSIVGSIGLTGNYISMIVLFSTCAVFNSSLANKNTIHIEEPRCNPDHIARIEKAMKNEKLYLDGELTLEVLAGHVDLSPRTVSHLLNKHFGCHFFEFVNRYRMSEAKDLLQDKLYADKTILEIMYKTGFNSKATFNAFFKKHEGITPREFRKQH